MCLDFYFEESRCSVTPDPSYSQEPTRLFRLFLHLSERERNENSRCGNAAENGGKQRKNKQRVCLKLLLYF